MKKSPFLFLFPFLMTLSACTTLVTYVPDVGARYEAMPVTAKQGFFRWQSGYCQMGDFYLSRKTGASLPLFVADNVSLNKETIFCQGWYSASPDFEAGTPVADGAVTMRSTRFDSDDGNSSLSVSKMSVLTGIDNQVQRYTTGGVGAFGDTHYLTFKDPLLGDLSIVDYMAANSASPSGGHTNMMSATGLQIFVAGKEFGILGFYEKPVFYRNKATATGMTETARERATFYTLLAYTAWEKEAEH
jgi:hypothetical protein